MPKGQEDEDDNMNFREHGPQVHTIMLRLVQADSI